MNHSSEVDVNVLITLYNQKLSTLTNQNILLEAKLQTLIKEFEDEKNILLIRLADLEINDGKSKKKSDGYQQSEVE